MTQKIAVVCSLFLALVVFAGMAQAQSPYRVDYFSNANTGGAPDGTLRLDNDGSAADANLCADIFVFDTNEELSECCSCLETPDGLRTLAAKFRAGLRTSRTATSPSLRLPPRFRTLAPLRKANWRSSAVRS